MNAPFDYLEIFLMQLSKNINMHICDMVFIKIILVSIIRISNLLNAETPLFIIRAHIFRLTVETIGNYNLFYQKL